jgi:two-component system sensor histidine kinase MprB
VRSQLAELTTLVADVVELARGNEPQGERTPQRLDHLVERCVERARLLAPTATISVNAAPCTVSGVGPQLERALSNLLDNAIKWNLPDAPIEVAVSDGEVTVRDHGPGIEERDLPHVFDRFYRAEAARASPGSGLGLAIVQQAALAHGGTVTAERPAGGGALLRVRLPTLADPLGNGDPR